MVPTLAGRIQTRLFLLAVIGGPITLVLTPFLLRDIAIGDRYRITYIVLATVAVIGVAWELVYHLLMQFRWEKDWPTLFALLTFLPEGLLIWWLLRSGYLPTVDGPAQAWSFWFHFVTVWLAVWLFAQGPMRVPFIRWRFRGGRVV
jgi:hypothetical protein